MPPSLRDLVSYTSNFLSQLPLFKSVFHNISPYEPLSGAPFCPLDGPISCLNTTPVTGDSCCFVHPGGRVLLAQFWDQEVLASGAEEGWTLHGLWYGMSFSLPAQKQISTPDGHVKMADFGQPSHLQPLAKMIDAR